MVLQTLSSARLFRKANVIHIGKNQPCKSKNKSFGVFLYYYKLFFAKCQEKTSEFTKKYTDKSFFCFIDFTQKTKRTVKRHRL